MRIRPPRIGAWLLGPLLPGGTGHPLLGHLEEEFTTEAVPRLGASAARRRYLWECLMAAGPLLSTGLAPRGAAILASLLLVALPLVVMEVARSFVLSQIPLKEGRAYGGDFLCLQLVAVALLCAGAARLLRASPPRDAAPAGGTVLLIVASALAMLTAVGPSRPAGFWALGLPVVVFSAAVGSLNSRRRNASLEEAREAR